MIAHKKEFFTGVGMIIAFVIVLIIVFSPVFRGQNGLDYLDSLYNSISKGSAYYIPKVKEKSDHLKGISVIVTLDLANQKQAEQTALLFKAGGAEAVVQGAQLKVTGDLGQILENCLADADAMYHNDGKKVSSKYNYDEKQVLYNWWGSFNAMEKDLEKQKKFKEANMVALVVKKAVESSYNYYKIEPQKITDRMGIVIFSLIFYVVYTMWYGFAIMFMFEGWGMRLGH
jgi:Fe2+ transport system protein B